MCVWHCRVWLLSAIVVCVALILLHANVHVVAVSWPRVLLCLADTHTVPLHVLFVRLIESV